MRKENSMPIVNGKYKNPGWVNLASPALNTQNLNDISNTLEKLDAGGGTGSGVTSFNGRTGAVTPQAGDYTAAQVGAVPTTRKVNGKPLSSDITLTASDVSARPDTWTPTAAQVGAVPTSRTVNGKALSSNITLTASDVGTAPITYGTTDLTPGSSSLATGSVYLVYE